MQHLAASRISYSDLTREDVVGEGGYATIYRGTYMGCKVAVKELKNLKPTKRGSVLDEPSTHKSRALSDDEGASPLRRAVSHDSELVPSVPPQSSGTNVVWSTEAKKVRALLTTSYVPFLLLFIFSCSDSLSCCFILGIPGCFP